MDSNIIILNPDYHFKNDIDRIIIYSGYKVADYSDADWFSIVHPIQGLIFSLFSQAKSLREVIESISSEIGLDFVDTQQLIQQFINNESSIYTEYNGVAISLPRNILISANRIQGTYIPESYERGIFQCPTIDLTDTRMHKAPHTFTLMLTNKCVTDCKYCYAKKSSYYDEMTTSQILEIIHQAKSLGVRNIDIIGGEVFCRKDWHIIITELVRLDMSPSFISTKVPISENIARKLLKTGFDRVIQLSIDSLNDVSLHDIINCNKDYLQNIENGIDILQKYSFTIQINTIVTKYSTNKELIELYNFIKKIKKLKYWEIRTPKVSIYNTDSFNEIKKSKEDVHQLYSFIREEIIPGSDIPIEISMEPVTDQYNNCKITGSTFNGTVCSALEDFFFVLPDGRVTICEELYDNPLFIIGDLKRQTIEEVWNSRQALNLYRLKQRDIQKNSPCRVCKSFEPCIVSHRRCWTNIIRAYGADNWDFPDPRCESAPRIPNGILY